jgi:hypothetical protein
VTDLPRIPSGTMEGDLLILTLLETVGHCEIVSHCQRPGCGLPLGDLVMFDAQDRAVCHRHSLSLVPTPPPTLQERLASYKRGKLVR